LHGGERKRGYGNVSVLIREQESKRQKHRDRLRQKREGKTEKGKRMETMGVRKITIGKGGRAGEAKERGQRYDALVVRHFRNSGSRHTIRRLIKLDLITDYLTFFIYFSFLRIHNSRLCTHFADVLHVNFRSLQYLAITCSMAQ